MLIDRIAADYDFSPFKEKFSGQYATGRIANQKVTILKPSTYMNDSGQSVRATIDFFKIETDRTVIAHDELDLTPGKIRVKHGGGHAGHNGLRSIHQHLGTDSYKRLRLGIGHPGHKDRVSPYVLSDFSKNERETWLPDFIKALSDHIPLLLSGQDEDYMTQVARHAPAPE